MRYPRAALVASLLVSACQTEAPPAEARTARERDSALGASEVLPGAAGVRGAMRAADTAASRNALRDSLAALP